MADFPRTIPSAQSTVPRVPGPLLSRGLTGKVQTRAVNAIGRTWTESWSALYAGNTDVQALVTFIEDTYHQGDTITVTHYLLPGSGKAPNGNGGGTPLVETASQTGATLSIDGWTNSATGVMLTGDCFTVSGLNQLFRCTATADASSSGVASIPINPPLVTGGSPAANAAITTTGAKIRAVIDAYNVPTAGPDEFMGNLSVTFFEAI